MPPNIMSAPLCTQCFENVGLRKMAEAIAGPAIFGKCPHCAQIQGLAIDVAVADRLMTRFFCTGSIPPESGGPAHLYAFNEHNKPGDVTFATELDHDVRTLSDFLGVGLFHYGPPLWRLGYTDHYQSLRNSMDDGAFQSTRQRKAIWRQILERCQTTILSPKTEVFKVRKGDKLPPALASEFDTSPSGIEGGSRFESEGLRIFYGAEDIETCLHETRVTLADWIALATVIPNRPLRLVDLSGDIDDSKASNVFERIDIFMRRISFVGKADYDLCRELGFDGFYFTSYFAQAHHNNLRNIALFGFPIAEGKVSLRSVNRIRLTTMSYEFTFGPSNDTSLPIDESEALAITAKLQAFKGGSSEEAANMLKDAAKELRELATRKSAGLRIKGVSEDYFALSHMNAPLPSHPTR
jgi:RES domain